MLYFCDFLKIVKKCLNKGETNPNFLDNFTSSFFDEERAEKDNYQNSPKIFSTSVASRLFNGRSPLSKSFAHVALSYFDKSKFIDSFDDQTDFDPVTKLAEELTEKGFPCSSSNADEVIADLYQKFLNAATEGKDTVFGIADYKKAKHSYIDFYNLIVAKPAYSIPFNPHDAGETRKNLTRPYRIPEKIENIINKKFSAEEQKSFKTWPLIDKIIQKEMQHRLFSITMKVENRHFLQFTSPEIHKIFEPLNYFSLSKLNPLLQCPTICVNENFFKYKGIAHNDQIAVLCKIDKICWHEDNLLVTLEYLAETEQALIARNPTIFGLKNTEFGNELNTIHWSIKHVNIFNAFNHLHNDFLDQNNIKQFFLTNP